MSSVATAPRHAVSPDLPPLRVTRRRWTYYILPVFTIGMIVYLASPVFLMILYSFNNIRGERQVPEFTCCTLNWWKAYREFPDLNAALATSIKVAIPASLIASVLGSFIGLVLGRYPFRGRALVNFVVFLAIAIPEIVLGSALLTMFVQTNVTHPAGLTVFIGYPTILFSHIAFSIPFVAITVRARVQGLDRSLEDAAQDLFAPPVVTFFKITLPLILPGIVAGFLLSFVLSLDDFVITNFVRGQTNTFPTWVFGASRLGVPPQVNVWGSILFGVGVLLAGVNLARAHRSAA
ncbi:MAG: ABC transporter permease [Actinomycetota bacterium]|jgi:spermidine/putrescine transport system permease protein|nr:ABC transporter permease [Actinomycetota bacterium]